ncbi:keratinocyte differentiation factor 1-like [Megalops cyprinoides]|uniref:keratinocyte differentiation factor 1-like n=1 Tax=Megalops cyprinoides TaxID=118141 RepID=UPI001864393A|nr:keratinocyte differentiation factor 1-like [Megalops cyprinoides]XP_036371832.1 keratinocyte differentiation factor 1-like [Megalops cyprinoides]
MPGSGTSNCHNVSLHARGAGMEEDSSRQQRLLSQDSSDGPECYQERCVDPVDPLLYHGVEMQPTGIAQKARPRDALEQDSETLGYIPGSASSSRGEKACSACPAPGWRGCRVAVCYLLTCGLYRACHHCRYVPCLPANESSTDPPERDPTEAVSPVCVEPKPSNLLQFDSIRYPDIRIAGKEVILPDTAVRKSAPSRPPEEEKGNSQRPFSSVDNLSLQDDEPDEWDEDGGDVDALIARKLLELYTLHQIEQLALCTSDSVFLSKTGEISRLIRDVVQEHHLQEEEAECRLVHGIIRISTRKSRRKRRPRREGWGSGVEGTPRDSGNDTMMDSLDSNYIDHVQISEQTSADKLARQMWASGRRAHSSSSPTTSSACHQDVDSSGTPLLYTIRT